MLYLYVCQDDPWTPWLVEMAQLNIAIDHEQTPRSGPRKFERTVTEAKTQFSLWIHRPGLVLRIAPE